FRKHGPPWHVSIGRVFLPVLLVLGLAAGAMGYYHWRVTGNPLQPPNVLATAIYSPVPPFLWQPLQTGQHYHHDVVKAYNTQWAKDQYLQMRTVNGYAQEAARRINSFFSFFFGIALLVPVVAIPWGMRNPWMGFAVATCAWVQGALLATTWCQPHYSA